jgi:hypothetical protein
MSDSQQNEETRAVEALITAALHVWDHEITAEEIASFLNGEISLSPEDEAALERLGMQLPKNRASSEVAGDGECGRSQELLALHRKKPSGGFSAATEQELNRKREELRKRFSGKKR